MRLTLLFLLIISSYSLIAKESTEYDKKSVVFYIQSKISPMIFNKCGELFPEFSDAFKIGLVKWNKTNEQLIKHGKEISQKEAGLSGKDFDIYIEKEIELKEMKVEMNKKSKRDLKEGCGEALVYLITES